jgi:hypothetical protein
VKLEATFTRRCEAIAVDWRYRLRLAAHDPLPANRLLHELGGEAVTPQELTSASPDSVKRLIESQEWSAGIVRLSPLLIVYHPSHSPARYQSNMMHEIAHVLLKHPMVGFDPTTGLPTRDARCEEEATYLGGCLQVPRIGLQRLIGQGYGTVEIALHFGASEKMITFRMNVTGLQIP